MSLIGKISSFRLQAECRAPLLDALRDLHAYVEAEEPGTIVFLVHSDQEKPDTIWLYSVFADEDARLRHLSSPAYAKLTDLLPQVTSAVEETNLLVIENKGLVAGGGTPS